MGVRSAFSSSNRTDGTVEARESSIWNHSWASAMSNLIRLFAFTLVRGYKMVVDLGDKIMNLILDASSCGYLGNTWIYGMVPVGHHVMAFIPCSLPEQSI